MSFAAFNIGTDCLRVLLITLLALTSVSAHSQVGEPSGQSAGSTAGEISTKKTADQEKQPPLFSAAGVHGTTAPSGYSTGLGREETSAVMKGVSDLNQDLLSELLPDRQMEDCSREPLLTKAAAAEPAAFGPNHALGVFYLTHGDFVRSIAFLDAARRAQPADIGNSRALALALLGAQRNAQAVALLERETRADSKDPALLRLLALAYQLSGAWDKSVQAYQRASSMASWDVNNQFDSGLGLLGTGASEAAAELFAAATVAHPDSAKLWLGLGLVQDTKREKAEAVRSLLRAIAIDPDYIPPYFFLAGLADVSPERAAEIRKLIAEFVVSHPNSAEAHYDYALALWKLQRIHADGISPGEIESQLAIALTANSDMARAHFLLGVIYADANDVSSAEKELLSAVKSEPENAEAHYRLAQVYKRDHKPENANAEMQRFLALHGGQGNDEDSQPSGLWNPAPDPIHRILRAAPCSGQPSAKP